MSEVSSTDAVSANDQAFPHTLVSRDVFGNLHTKAGLGLTKRELFAAMAMQGFCAAIEYDEDSGPMKGADDLAADAVMCADALLAELEKSCG